MPVLTTPPPMPYPPPSSAQTWRMQGPDNPFNTCQLKTSGTTIVTPYGIARRIATLIDRRTGAIVGDLLYSPEDHTYYAWPNQNLSAPDRLALHGQRGWVRVGFAGQIGSPADLGESLSSMLPWHDVEAVGIEILNDCR